VRSFLGPSEVAALRAAIDGCRGDLRRVGGKGGLGPRYRVLDGEGVGRRLPAAVELGETRVRPLVEAWAGEPLAWFGSPPRRVRVQLYGRQDDGFRWHCDGHEYVALITLVNENQGETQLLSPGWSAVLRPLRIPLYPFPRLFDLPPRQAVTALPGDLLVMRGRRLLHRGVTHSAVGERVLLAFAFDLAGRRPNRARDWIARRLNY
jgi:hypothetical protein